MAQVFTLYVSKRAGFDTAGEQLLHDLKNHLQIPGLTNVQVINRYEIRGVSRQDLKSAVPVVLSEPPLDEVHEHPFVPPPGRRVLGIEYLPGQYDQRADSAAQCIQILMQGERPEVATARFFVFAGPVGDSEFERIRAYMINPVDSREAFLDRSGLDRAGRKPDTDVHRLPELLSLEAPDAADWIRAMNLTMTPEDLLFIRDHFRDRADRAPTLTEIRMLDTYWSDHCRHTTFRTELTSVDIAPGPYSRLLSSAWEHFLRDFSTHRSSQTKTPPTLMDMATMSMHTLKGQGRLEDMEVSGEINACSIVRRVSEPGGEREWLILFKNETHNHPTEIEPFGGAATCLGGAIRDPLSGRAYVYQAMRVTGCADPTAPVSAALPGKLPQRKITTEAAQGYSSYGNQIGLATGLVREIYHPGYMAKRMEVGAVIGAVPREYVVRREPRPGDRILLVGGRTGRDGIGGATGSSRVHTRNSLATAGAEVQKGNAPEERKLQRLFRDPEAIRMIHKCNDFGAGGVSVAVGELAAGVDVFLERVPLKYRGLNGTEIALSESQERMAVVVAAEQVAPFIAAAAKENLEATEIATVTDSRHLRMYWQDQLILDLERDFLDSHGVTQQASARIASPQPGPSGGLLEPLVPVNGDTAATWEALMENLNICSQQGLVERFDSSIGAGTVHFPLGGRYQDTPLDCMVARIPLRGSETATAMSFGFDPFLSSRSPFHGAVYAVVEAVSRLVAVGADPRQIRLSLQEYFEKLDRDPLRWGKPVSALLGAHTALMGLGLAAIGGKDSMSGSFHDLHVPPTLIAFAVGTLPAERAVSPEFKGAGNPVFHIPVPLTEGEVPDFSRLAENFRILHEAFQRGDIRSARAVGMGGTAETLTKMAMGNRIGLELLPGVDSIHLFRPEYGSLILEVPPGRDEKWLKSVGAVRIAVTTADPEIRHPRFALPLESLRKRWKTTLETVFPSRPAREDGIPYVPEAPVVHRRRPRVAVAHPRVFIPVFPGTNCEFDTADAFERAGAEVRCAVFRNRHSRDIRESLDLLAREIGRAQILALPGGFSAGDEPEGSGKFIAAVFRNPRLRDAVHQLLQERDGLILGICNGFQALVKLGLVPHGEIRNLTPASPTITYNRIGRHVSRMVRTRIASTLSPWFSRCRPGDIHTVPVSHGEGRFVAPADQIQALARAGQIATQYVDDRDSPTLAYPHNPNGSDLAVEGLTSPDGRVLGKMGHSERLGPHVAANIPDRREPALFAAGVAYFQ